MCYLTNEVIITSIVERWHVSQSWSLSAWSGGRTYQTHKVAIQRRVYGFFVSASDHALEGSLFWFGVVELIE